jgi:hypothetical protein
MTTLSALAAVFLKEHPNARRTLYGLATVIGPILAILQTTDLESLGPISLDWAAQWFPAAALPVGAVALANVKTPENQGEDLGGMFEDDFDVASFDPGTDDLSFS